MKNTIEIGAIIAINLPTRIPSGHEQEGLRPALVIGLPEYLDSPRFPTIVVIPLTTKIGDWSKDNKLYIQIQKGEGNIRKNSLLLIDQILSVDINRINGYIGTINNKKILEVKSLLITLFSLK